MGMAQPHRELVPLGANVDPRQLESKLTPSTEDLWHPRPTLVGEPDVPEHAHQFGIARIRTVASQEVTDGDARVTRIAEGVALGRADDERGLWFSVVSMGEEIDESFAECNMNRRVIDSHAVEQPKRYRLPLGQFRIDSLESTK